MVSLPQQSIVTEEKQEMALTNRATQFLNIMAACAFSDADNKPVATEDGILRAMQMLRSARERSNSVFVVGNGGSAGVASHAVTDFVNVAKLRAQTIHDPSILTCMTNDYGYENAFARILTQLTRGGDVLVAISSSGKSPNIHQACHAVRQAGGTVITLSGFGAENPLRRLGELNIWLDSKDYGMVEIGHQFVLHNIADRFGRENMVQEKMGRK